MSRLATKGRAQALTSPSAPAVRNGGAGGTLILGRWQEVLADVECDAVIFDPPYSDRNHSGYNAYAGGETSTRGRLRNKDNHEREAISYAHWTRDDIFEFVRSWSPRTRGWIAGMTSHDLIPHWEAAYAEVGRYCFAPVPCVIRGMSVRMMGDGPSSEAVHLIVARPRRKEFLKWGTLPGFYNSARSAGAGGGRGKPIDLMRAITRDYSRAGDLIADPTAGYATTGVAALGMGRRFIGAEVDAAAHAEGSLRLGRVQPVDLFDPQRATQTALFAEPARVPRKKAA